jgi:hypothetical protein
LQYSVILAKQNKFHHQSCSDSHSWIDPPSITENKIKNFAQPPAPIYQ